MARLMVRLHLGPVINTPGLYHPQLLCMVADGRLGTADKANNLVIAFPFAQQFPYSLAHDRAFKPEEPSFPQQERGFS